MKVRCPECREIIDLREAEAESVVDGIIKLYRELGRDSRLAGEYVDCFRTSPRGKVGDKKHLRLLAEVKQLIDTGRFEFNRRKYKTDRQTVIKALREVCNREKYGFTNHNYLKQVLITMMEQALKDRESDLRYPYRNPNQGDPPVAPPATKEENRRGEPLCSPEERAANLARIKELMEGMGGLPPNRPLTSAEKEARREALRNKI
jgi:hypothetical protein